MNTYDLQLSPNPSSPQLFAINNDHFLFEFTTYEDLIITIQSISGKGTIYWEADNNIQYSIQGKEDSIYLTNTLIDKSDDSKVFSNLYIQNNNGIDKKSPGFTFYIDYKLRSPKINLDEIQIGRSTQIAYRNTDLPIYIYSQLKDLDKDTNIFVTLYELVGEQYKQLTNKIPFEISATVVDELTIQKAKANIELINNINFDLKGTYDPMIKTGLILFAKDYLNNKKIDKKDIPTIIVKVSKNNDYPEIKTFSRINLEAAMIQENSDIPIVSDTYHYGKLSLNRDKNIYKLKTDKTKKYMRIHYSSNSQHINYTINNIKREDLNSSFSEYTNEIIDGKLIITFNSAPEKNDYIYLIIFHNNDNKAKSDKTTNYVFKYMNSDNINDFKLYQLSSNEKMELEEKKKENKYDYIFTFPMLKYPDIKISYFIKFVTKDKWIEGEESDCIALRESTSLEQELYNYEVINETIIQKFENIEKINYKYIQVIALVKDNETLEYVAYSGIYVNDSIIDPDEDESEEESDKDNTQKNESNNVVLKVVIIVICFIILLGIIILLVHIYLKKKRNLSENVEKLSGPMISKD